MVERIATIRNTAGIHCRPSTEIIKAIQGYNGLVGVTHDGHDCTPLTVIGLLQLELREGATVTVHVEGDDEAATCDRLTDLFQKTFDFPPRS